MTNFEYYKDEIEKATGDSLLCSFLKEHDKDWSTLHSSLYDATKWYLAEYVEPYKLTKFEKDILENVDSSLIYIVREKNDMYITESNKWLGFYVNYLFPNAKFDCLKNGEYYKIADILDNCEVVD